MKYWPLIMLLGVGLAAPVQAGARWPVLSPADLDSTIRELPLKAIRDPVAGLVSRLVQLEALPDVSPERPALRQALGIIRLARTIRLTSHGLDERPLVAEH